MTDEPNFDDVSAALGRPKTAVLASGWKIKPNGGLELRLALAENGATIKGLSLYLAAMALRPDEQVSVGLTIEGPRRPYCLARVDWRSSEHPNTSVLCGDLRFISAGKTHFHNPLMIAEPSSVIDALKANLPAAASIDPAPKNFGELLACCARLLNVTNLTMIAAPPWQQNF